MSETEKRTPDEQPNAALVDAVLAHAREQLGWELDEDAAGEVRKNAERHLKMAAKLRTVPLKNADEPDFIFRPYRAEG